jgi:hypothetical protein
MEMIDSDDAMDVHMADRFLRVVVYGDVSRLSREEGCTDLTSGPD